MKFFIKTSLLSILLPILILLISCNNTPQTAQDILNKTIEKHDPNSSWNTFDKTIQLHSNSIYTEGKTENINIDVNVSKDRLCYKNKTRNVACCFEDTTVTDLLKNQECETYSWTKDFYTYIWGLPMKLNDPNTPLEKGFDKVKFNSIDCYSLKVNYEKEHWEYYINTDSYFLEGFKFTFNNDSTKGEIVINEGTRENNSLIFPTKRTWYSLQKELIGTDSLIKIQ